MSRFGRFSGGVEEGALGDSPRSTALPCTGLHLKERGAKQEEAKRKIGRRRTRKEKMKNNSHLQSTSLVVMMMIVEATVSSGDDLSCMGILIWIK